MNDHTGTLSLFELNNLVKGVIHNTLSDTFWVRAEMSDVRVNQNGHCYLEFIEKDSKGRSIVAKSRGMIWANTFFMLRQYFEEATKQTFASGLKVLVRVSIEFHELYGFSLTVLDIDPSYTLGDQAANRAAILKQLEQEGVLELNKELDLPTPTHRIAVISSPTAAGYEDFIDQLSNNPSGYKFYPKLFSAIMQGDRAEVSVIEALEEIYRYQDLFDAVVIIRGGGATSDLSCFDSYLLAASCAQFPLPIIVGIGHERDETVLDIVAHTRAKTPTAVAEFLISEMDKLAVKLESLQLLLVTNANKYLQDEFLELNTYQTRATLWLKNWSKNQQNILSSLSDSLKRSARQKIKNNASQLESYDKIIGLISPENILKKGYSITLKEGKALRNTTMVETGDTLTTMLWDGEIKSVVK